MDTDETRIRELEVEEHPQRLIHRELTEAIGAAFEVHNVLGYGFLEKVYQRALQAGLIRRGMVTEIERALPVNYKGIVVGEYFADLVAEEKVVVELKVATELNPPRRGAIDQRTERHQNPGRPAHQFSEEHAWSIADA